MEVFVGGLVSFDFYLVVILPSLKLEHFSENRKRYLSSRRDILY